MNAVLLERMLVEAPTLTVKSRNDDVVRLFNAMPSLHAVAIIDDGRPVALINRRSFMDQYALPYHREVFGKRPCMQFANLAPLVVERGSTLEQIARLFANDDQRDLSDGFIVTENGRYAGLATGASMVRAVTEVRVEAARYANPLTFLPGNVPLNSHIDRLIANGSAFVACYFDLDHFKPFNDRYGYWQGDEVLKATANTSRQSASRRAIFSGTSAGMIFCCYSRAMTGASVPGARWKRSMSSSSASIRWRSGSRAAFTVKTGWRGRRSSASCACRRARCLSKRARRAAARM